MFPNCLHVLDSYLDFWVGATSCSPLRGSQKHFHFSICDSDLALWWGKVVRSTSQQTPSTPTPTLNPPPALCLPFSCSVLNAKIHIGRKMTKSGPKLVRLSNIKEKQLLSQSNVHFLKEIHKVIHGQTARWTKNTNILKQGNAFFFTFHHV